MFPRPESKRLLHDQDTHRSERVWKEGYSSNKLLNCDIEACVKRDCTYNTRMDRYLQLAGFYGVARLPFIQLDWVLITALVERWRPKAHTFHMRHGKMAVTMEDVGVQFGLPVDGEAVVGSTSLQLSELCDRLLGVVPTHDDICFGRLKIKWLADKFERLPLNALDEVVCQYTRAFILQLIREMVFPDKTQSRVHLMYLALLEEFYRAGGYSRGAAYLAWLYQQLCRAANKNTTQIVGPLSSLQIWAWDHSHIYHRGIAECILRKAKQLQKIQARYETRDPKEMYFISNEVQRCRDLLEAHVALKLHGRTDEHVGTPKDFGTCDPSQIVVAGKEEQPSLVGFPTYEGSSSQQVLPVMEPSGLPRKVRHGRSSNVEPVAYTLVSQITQLT